MEKIITGFRTIEDVEKTLQWIENNTNYVWNSLHKPTEYFGWKNVFDINQQNGGFYIEYFDKFCTGSIGGSGDNRYQINFKDLIGGNFTRGEKVLVRDIGDWKEGIYLTTIEGAIRDSYIIVHKDDEEKFIKGKKFDWNSYNEIKRLDEK